MILSRQQEPPAKDLPPGVLIKPDAAEVSRAAAELFVAAALSPVEKTGRFSVALSGGSTPRNFHRMLAEKPIARRIPWDRVHIFWVDERCVPADDPWSNYGSTAKDLLDHIPIPPQNLYPIPGDLRPDEGTRRYRDTLVRFFSLKKTPFPVFDLICLGLGRDGHTASLFPGQEAIGEMERPVVYVKGGDPFVERITLTLPVLNRGRRIVFLVTGEEKAEIVRKIIRGKQENLPACRVRPLTGELLWFLDRAAAGRLH